jgi:uncharacterized protein YkwD
MDSSQSGCKTIVIAVTCYVTNVTFTCRASTPSFRSRQQGKSDQKLPELWYPAWVHKNPMEKSNWLVSRWLAAGLLIVVLIAGLGLEGASGAAFTSNTSGTIYLPIISQAEPPPPGCGPYFPPDDALMEQQTMDGLNDVRASHGLNRLNIAPQLVQATRRHSRDMADNFFFSHTGSDGSTPFDRMVAACYYPNGYGEIIAAGYTSAADVIQAWMDSAGHRTVILTSYYTEFGAGYAVNPDSPYRRYWTVNFSLPHNPGAPVTAAMYLCTYTLAEEGRISMLRILSPDPCD